MTEAVQRRAEEDAPSPQPAIRPVELPADVPKLFYRRGSRWPRAIAWFGFKSFWGHLWHLAASVIATEDIDSRDWMHPDEPEVLTRRIAQTLRAKNPTASTLADALDDDVWVDFIADTGDDFSVSRAVAEMLFARYEVEDPAAPGTTIVLPRGQILVFGGDTAYPVATDIEIQHRVIVPFNEILKNVDDGEPRALLGVPGNHDWFAGLDGFGRLFRWRKMKLDRAADLAAAASDGEIDRLGQIGHFIEWVEAFRVGRYVVKRAALALRGYAPVQSASYWALRIAPNVDFWGVDRQLRTVDFHQRSFFAELSEQGRGIVLCLADPVHAFLEPNPAGMRTMASLDLDMDRDGILVLTGDTHHYCRQTFGKGIHVIAGGGGAFLHPQCIARRGLPEPDREFPGQKTTLVLALQVPWQIVHGRSGFLVHAGVALTYAPLFGTQWSTGTSALTASIITSIVAFVVFFLLGGFRHKAARIGALSLVTGGVFGFLPLVVFEACAWIGLHANIQPTPFHLALVAFGASVYLGTLLMGTYLMLLTILGLEQHQAFGALAHPGYKHIVRLRFRRDGSRVDGWVLGKVDPLQQEEETVLVDQFTWKNPKMPDS